MLRSRRPSRIQDLSARQRQLGDSGYLFEAALRRGDEGATSHPYSTRRVAQDGKITGQHPV